MTTVYDRIFTEKDFKKYPRFSEKQMFIENTIKEFAINFGLLHKRKPVVVKFVCGVLIYNCVGVVHVADMELIPKVDWSILPNRIILEIK